MPLLWPLVALCVIAIGSCHWLAGLLSQRPPQVQERLASFGGGAGLAYVFIHLLPELASGGRTITEAVRTQAFIPTAMTESLLFLTTLIGVLVPYVLNVITKQMPASQSWTDFDVTGNHFENFAPHLIEQFRAQIAAVMGQHQLQPFSGGAGTRGLPPQQLVENVAQGHWNQKIFFCIRRRTLARKPRPSLAGSISGTSSPCRRRATLP